MANKLIKKHDELSKNFLTDIASARSFLELYLDPQVIKRCDLDTLSIEPNSYIDNELREKFSDIVYKLSLKDKSSSIYVYVLIEHQSSAERLMPLRILQYQIEIIQAHIAKHKQEENLPLVVPLVFYNGDKSPYPYATDILDLFADKHLVKYIGLGKFSLIDLTVMPDNEILKHKQLALLEMCLKHINARHFNNVINHILNAFIVAHDSKIDRKLFDSSISYLMNAKEYEDLKPLFGQLIDNFKEYEEDIMSYAEQLRQEGMQKGRQEAQHDMVLELLKSGVDEHLIVKASKLSPEEIEKIKKTMH